MKRMAARVEGLVIPNVENLRWATSQSINQTFLHFGQGLSERLTDTIAATHGAIRGTLARRSPHAEATADEIASLEAASRGLEEIRAGLKGI